MTRPTRVEVNCTTGETSIIELTDAEIAQMEADAAVAEAQRKADEKAAADKATARAAILDRLGLTADEAAILLG
jgi:acyl-CoA reductase-like NAD-dependent aldehyde dehydrogenase